MTRPTFSDTKTETPSCVPSGPGKGFHLLAGANSSVRKQHHNDRLSFIRRDNAKAQAWEKQSGSVCHGSRLHGNELWTWSRRGSAAGNLSHPGRGRTRSHLL